MRLREVSEPMVALGPSGFRLAPGGQILCAFVWPHGVMCHVPAHVKHRHIELVPRDQVAQETPEDQGTVKIPRTLWDALGCSQDRIPEGTDVEIVENR